MSPKTPFIKSATRFTLALSLVFLIAVAGFGQDPSGRPTDPPSKSGGKKPPKKPPVKTEPVPLTVTLTILSDPPESTVFINGEERGVTNAEGKFQLEKMALGGYSVEVRKEGYSNMLRGFNAGGQTPTLVFKLEPNFDIFTKQFDSLVAEGKLAGPESPNALEVVNNLVARAPDRPEVKRMRGVLVTKLMEPVTPVIDNTATNWRSIKREEITRGLESAGRALEINGDDARVKAVVSYFKGVLALYDWQKGGQGEGSKPAAENDGGLAAARSELENAVKLDESFAAARYQLGVVLMAAGDAVGAEAVLARAVQLQPRWAFAQAALGSAFHAQGKYKDAVDSFRRATEIDQNQPAAVAGLGLARHMKGEKDGVRDVERALKMDPMSALAHLNMGIILSQSKNKRDFVRAEEEIKKAIELNPNNLEFQNSAAEKVLADLQARKK